MNDLEKLYELIKSASPSFGLSIEAFAESMNDESYVDSLRSWASESSQEIVDEIDSLSLKRGEPVDLVKKKDGTSQEEGTGFSWFQEDTSLESAGYVPPMESQESDESITIDDTPFSVEEVMTPEEVSDYRSEQYPLQKSGLITNRKYFESLGGDVDQMLTDIVNERVSETKEEQTDEFKQKARDLWNEMSSFKTTWRTSGDIDNWDKGPSLVESYKNFEEFLSVMSQPVIEDSTYSLKVFDPYAFKDDLEKSRYMNMTYRLDLERERLESEKKEKDKKRNEILEEEKERLKTAAGEDPFRFTEEKFKRWLDEQETVGKAGANLIKRKNPRRREELWQKWRDTQEQMKEQLTPLDDKDQDFIDAYLSEITPSLIDKEEDEVVPLMNEKYGRFGFVFEKSGALTDQMIVTSKKEGVSPLYVNLDPISESSEIFYAQQLRDYIKKNAIHSEAIVEDEDKMFTEKSLRAQSLRDKGGLDNDGVSMTSGEYDGKNVAYPTLFPKDPNNYTEDPGDWMELSGDAAYDEALKRGEVFYFDTPSEARNFAEGSWKYANLADVEAEKFFEERGLDYRSMHMAYEQYEDLMERVKLIDDEGFLGRGGEIIKVSPDEIWMAEHQGLVTYESKDVGGRFKSTEGKQLYARIRNDIDDYYKTINEQADALYDDGFYTTAIREAREDWDVYSHQKMVERRKSGARLNGIAKGVLNEVNKESINLFKKPLDEVDASLLSGQQLADYNTLKEVQKKANVSKKFASQEYLNADTYLDSKFDKKMTEHFKENFEGFMTQVKSGLRNGQAAEQILMISLGLTDASSREELMKAADEIVRFKTLSQSYGIQGVSERANKARNASEFWDTVFNDPFEYILGLAANSMAQMLPYGWWITGTATGAGAATGSAIPVLGTVAGAKAGFTIGMAATSFAMEYTNAVLEAGENQGYDMMNPQDVLLALEDKNVWEEGAEIGTKRGVPIAVIDLISGGVAGKVFKVGSVASKGSRIAGQVAERAIFDPIMEGVGEISAQYVAGQDMDWKEIVAESLGGLGGNAPNMAVNMLAEFKQKSKIQLAENLIDIERMAKEKASDETISNWANRMHKTGQIDADMNQRIQENVGHRREAKSLLETDKFARVLGGKKTKEEARVMQLLQARDELSSTTNRKQVFKAKIKAINEELAIMAETKAMAPENSMVELALEEGKKPELSRYSIDGKQYTKKAFLDKVGAMSEDKRANKKIQVFNDPETAQQVGLKTIELDAVQKQQTEEGVLRPEAEEPTDEVGLQEVGQVQPEEVQEEALKGFDKKTVVQGKRTTHSYTDKSTGESVASVSFYEQSNGDIEVEGISVEKNYRRKGVAESIYNSLNKEASKKDGVLKSYGQFAQTGRAVPAKSLWNKLVDQGKAELVKEDKSLKTYPDASPNKEVSVYRMIPAKQQQQAKEVAPAEVATQEDVVVVDKGTKEDVKAFREGTIEDSRLESLLAGVAARKNEGKKLTKFQQEMFDANQERVEKLQVESKLIGEIFDVDETTKPTKVQPEEIVYHGSPTKIQGGKLKKGSSEAIFLTPQKQYAQAYTGTQGQGEITETTITEDKKSKLFDLRNQEHVERLKQGFLKNNEDLEIEYDSEESALRDYENAIRSMNESAKDREGVNDWASGGQWMDAMENAGFEGAIFSERPGVISYALFDKEIDVTKPSAQVKAEVAAKEDVVEEGKLQPQLETGKREDVEGVAAEKEMAMSEMEEAGVELAEDPFTVEQPAPDAEVITITLDKDNPLTKDLERIGLKDLEGKKVNLVMADRLKVDKKNMGGPFFPLIKALRGKIAWASIDNEAASFIVKGAIDADYTVVYNMSSSGVDSNKVMGRQLIEKLDAISPQKKQEVFQLIKDHIKKLDNKNINKIKGLVAKSTSLDQLVDSIYNPDKNDVDVRAAFTKAILPSEDVLEGSKSTPIANEMRKLGITIEGLRDEASEEFTRNIPTGSMTMVLEITDKKGNKVTEKTADEAIVSREEQKKEGFPQHENYPVYIRGRVVGLLKETTPFWNVMPDYLKTINKKVAGLIKTIRKTKPLETLTPQELKVFEKLKAVFDAKNTKDKLEALSKVRLSKDLDKDIRETLRAQIIAAKKLRNKNDINDAVKQAITPFVKKGKISAKKARAEAIRSAEMSASVVRDVSSPKASTYQKFVSVLRRSFPSVEVVSTQKEFDELAKDIYAKKLTTKDQKVYGAVYKGKLYLNPGLANYNTPIHEFGHVWLNVAKEANKALYNKGLSLIKEEGSYVEKVKKSKSYKKVIGQMRKDGVSESDIEAYVLEEALAMAIGDRGESFVVAAQKKNFKNWLSTLYGYVRKLTGISKYTSEQIETISLDEFLDAVNVDLLSGKSLFEGYQVSNMGDQLQLQSDIRAKKIKGDPRSIIADAQQKGFTNEDIKSVLIAQGFDEVLVNSYLDVQLDLITEAPSSFDRVEGGAIKGLELFQDVKERLDKYANRKSKKTKKKPTPEMIRKRAMDLMMENSIWKAQPENIQAELLIAFDQLLGIEVNQTVDMQITNLKNMVTPPLDIKQVKKKFNKVLRGLGVPKQLKSGPQVKQLATLINNLTDKNYDESIKKAVEIIDVMLDKQLTQQQRANQKLEKQKAESDRKLNDLKQKLDDYKKKAAAAVMNQKDIVYGKTMLSTLIKKTLPKGELTNTEVKRLLTRIERVKSQESFKTEADNTVKLIEKIRTRLKKNKIKDIASVVKEISKLKVTQSGKVRTKGRVDARTHEYFGNLLPVINTIMGVSPYKDSKLVKNKKGIQNSWDSMSDLKDYLSSEKTLELIDEIESKLINGETVTPKEQALLDLRDGVNLLGDVDLASLEDVENILSDLKDLKKEGRSFLSEKLQREKEERARIRLEANENISKSMPFLFIKEGGIASATITVDTKKDGTLYVKSVTFFNEKGEVIKRQLGGEYIDGTFYNLRHKFQYVMEDPNATDFERQVMEQALQKSNAINGKDPITQEDIDRMEELRDIGILDEYEQAELEALESLMEAEQTVDVTNEALVPRNRDQLERNKTAISEDLKKLKVWSALRNWGKAYKGMETPKKALEFFRNRLSTLETFCNILDRKGTWFRDNIYRPLNRMEETRLANTQNKESVFESIARSVGAKSIKKMQRDVSKKRIKLMIRGEQSVLNGDDMMRLIALSRNETQMEKLKAMGITQLEIDQMEGIVGSQAVDFVDAVVGYLSTEYYDQINNVYKSVYNINMPYIENYFPTETLTANPKGTDFILEGNFGKAFEADAASALKQRSDVTSDVKIETADGFFGTLSTHIESMERFKAYAEGTKKLQTAWKTKAVQTALAATNLNAVMGKTIALSINPQGMPATPSRVATWLQSKYTGYALAWKTIQILKQASSFIQAMPYFTVQPKLKVKVPGIDLLAFTVAHATTMLRLVSPMKTGPLANPVYKAAGISATFKERLKQGFRGDLETLVSGIVEGRTRKPGWKKSRFRRGLRIAAGAPTVIGDILGVLGYMTVYEQNIRNGMSKEEALEKFNEYNATQQTRRGTERVGLQQPTGDAQEFKRVFAAFGSTLFLQLNKVAQTSKNISRAIRDGKLPKKSDINSLIINYAVANMLFVASANIMKLTRGDDEEKEEVYARMKEAMLGLTILFKMPFLGGAIESAYKEWQGERPFGTTGVNPALSVYRDVSKAIKEKDALTGAKVAGELIMGMQFDVPTSAVKAMGGDYSQENVQDLMGLSTSYRVEEPEGYVVDYGKISDKELKKKNPELYKRKKQREKQREKAQAPRDRARKMRERSRKGR